MNASLHFARAGSRRHISHLDPVQSHVCGRQSLEDSIVSADISVAHCWGVVVKGDAVARAWVVGSKLLFYDAFFDADLGPLVCFAVQLGICTELFERNGSLLQEVWRIHCLACGLRKASGRDERM